MKSQPAPAPAIGRLACLLRALESPAAESSPHAGDAETLEYRESLLAGLPAPQRPLLLDELRALSGQSAAESAAQTTSAPAPAGSDLQRTKASLELQLQTEQTRARELERDLKKLRSDHEQALETLRLQQKKLKELTDERARLLNDLSLVENKLRVQINENEQLAARMEKIQSTRQLMGEQSTEQTERINSLREEVEQLRAELEAQRQRRDRDLGQAHEEVRRAGENTAEAVIQELWRLLQTDLPEAFSPTHVPTRATVQNLGEAVCEMVRALATIEAHVIDRLKHSRQLNDPTDKISSFYNMLSKSPGLLDTLRDFLVTGRRKSNFVNLLRAHQVWAQALATGPNKALIRSAAQIFERLNYRRWPLEKGRFVSEEAAIGKYFRENVRTLADEMANELRKLGADLSYQDYDDLMKRR